MVPDPYKALNLPHTATTGDIKRSYRDLARQYHPDRLTQATDEEREEATQKFSFISAAYAVLMDPQRKAQYDHIYKYGGFDHEEDTEEDAQEPRKMPQRGVNQPNANASVGRSSRKRKPKGVGYSCTDPFAFLYTSDNVLTTTKVAGLKLPSRFQAAPGTPAAGFQVSISTGEFRYDGEKRQYTSRTTQFAQGKKSTKTETTTIHSDGRKEVLIQGDNFTERKTTTVSDMSHEDHLPWYLKTWHVVKGKIEMCYAPQVGAVTN